MAGYIHPAVAFTIADLRVQYTYIFGCIYKLTQRISPYTFHDGQG
jgi:hypothetical protein